MRKFKKEIRMNKLKYTNKSLNTTKNTIKEDENSKELNRNTSKIKKLEKENKPNQWKILTM